MAKSDVQVLLVHGSWHDGWCWSKVTPYLDRAGISWRAPDLPLRSFRSDAEIVRTYIDEMPEGAVVVAHSRGGVVITRAAAGASNIKHLIYISSNLPIDGALRPRPPEHLSSRASVGADDPNGQRFTVCDHALVREFLYDDCSDEDVAEAISHLRHSMSPPDDGNVADIDMSVLHKIASTFVVCTEDKCSPVATQRDLAKMTGEFVELASSHSAMLSHPEEVANIIIERLQR